jgi:hypothetical protein
VELRKTWALWFFQLLQRADPFLNSKAKTITIFLDLSLVLTPRSVRSNKSKKKKRKLNKWWKARVGSSIKKKKNEVLSYFITLMINSLYGFFYSLFFITFIWYEWRPLPAKKIILKTSNEVVNFDIRSVQKSISSICPSKMFCSN